MEEKHCTKTDVARACHITSQSIDNLINKGADMGARKLVRIADYFGVSLDYFFDRSSCPTNVGHKVNGNGNKVSGDIMLTECQREVDYLKNEINHMKELLDEKERTIKILLESQEYFNRNV